MIGRELPPLGKSPAVPASAEELLRLEDVSVRDRHGIFRLRNLSFEIRRGEILGIAGVSETGSRALRGRLRRQADLFGPNLLGGADIAGLGIRERIDLGIGYVPADRQKDGMVMEMSLAET